MGLQQLGVTQRARTGFLKLLLWLYIQLSTNDLKNKLNNTTEKREKVSNALLILRITFVHIVKILKITTLMNFKHFSLIILFLCSVFSLQAAIRCQAPAPESINIDHQEQTSTTISWAAVDEADYYRVVVSEFHSGRLVERVQLSSQTTYTVTDLTPGVTYQYDVKASSCEQGPYGPPASVVLGGTVVDIIFQLTTKGDAGLFFVDEVEGEFNLTMPFNPGSPSCYVVQGETTDLASNNTTFEFAINAGGGPTSLGYLRSNRDDFFVTDGPNPIAGKLDLGGPNTLDDTKTLFTLESTNFAEGPDMSMNILEPMHLTITGHEVCRFEKDRNQLLGQGNIATPEQAIDIYPNPVQDRLQVELPETGRVEIWDFAGRHWYSREAVESGVKQEVDVQAWPVGAYTLRWYPPNDQTPVVKYFMKH